MLKLLTPYKNIERSGKWQEEKGTLPCLIKWGYGTADI